ncbi:MAG: sulfide/dihydroorotate dehydrogenase-like FAD/NAD-binding protein [Elusimicrobiota bacterium]
MLEIIHKKKLAGQVTLLEIAAPQIARKILPGQFIILRVTEQGERIPLTVAKKDPAGGTITIIFQEVGKTTKLLATKEVGEKISNLAGPLGKPTETEKLGTVICVGGGVGVAELLPVAKAFKQEGNKTVAIIGARNKELIILEPEMREAVDEFYLTTDDGSAGEKGFVTYPLKRLLEAGTKIDLVYAIGPLPMMKNVSNLTKDYKIKTLVSLNPIMVDGTGMCGSCRVTINGKTQFACVDGPEFDGHAADWAELNNRLQLFRRQEQESLELYEKKCGRC